MAGQIVVNPNCCNVSTATYNDIIARGWIQPYKECYTFDDIMVIRRRYWNLSDKQARDILIASACYYRYRGARCADAVINLYNYYWENIE